MCVFVNKQVDELDSAMNALLVDTQQPQLEVIEKEEEVISLQPIGRGVHNLEPSAQSPTIKTSPVTSAFPTDGLLMLYISVSLSYFCVTICGFFMTLRFYILTYASCFFPGSIRVVSFPRCNVFVLHTHNEPSC